VTNQKNDSAWMPLYHRWRPVTLTMDLQVSYSVIQLEFNILFLAQMWLHQKWKTRGGELSVPSTGRPAIYWPQHSPPFFCSHPTMERDRETRGPRDSRTPVLVDPGTRAHEPPAPVPRRQYQWLRVILPTLSKYRWLEISEVSEPNLRSFIYLYFNRFVYF